MRYSTTTALSLRPITALSGLQHRADRDYEQSHTFSNVISIRYPWLNLITLNFGYHNAHHTKPTVPWHELPKLHEALYWWQGGVCHSVQEAIIELS